MELEKLNKEIGVPKLIKEIAEVTKLSMEEDGMVSKYKRMCVLESSLLKIKAKNKTLEKKATAEYKMEILEIKHCIELYRLRCFMFSDYFIPQKLNETEEKEDFRAEENFKDSVQHISMKIKASISSMEGEIMRAKHTLKRYGSD